LSTAAATSSKRAKVTKTAIDAVHHLPFDVVAYEIGRHIKDHETLAAFTAAMLSSKEHTPRGSAAYKNVRQMLFDQAKRIGRVRVVFCGDAYNAGTLAAGIRGIAKEAPIIHVLELSSIRHYFNTTRINAVKHVINKIATLKKIDFTTEILVHANSPYKNYGDMKYDCCRRCFVADTAENIRLLFDVPDSVKILIYGACK
jgi:hypothetical protein